MSEAAAVVLDRTTKVYRMQDASPQRLSLGTILGFRRKPADVGAQPKGFVALDNICLSVAKGERVGLVGRNGAGKTTLLKMLCGNFTPTSGTVQVNGRVQALMTIGTGFHPDHTGQRNAAMSLKYNGLSAADEAEAMRDIEEFCELGEFFDQPLKVYSLGMQARLMFAVATAVKPEILVVDEVLGAGDAYFIAKSKLRVERLVKSGCTMILVSHSMSQILELCTRAIWLDEGRIRMEGEAFLVVKAYEEFMHGPIQSVSLPESAPDAAPSAEPAAPSGHGDTLDAPPRTLSLPAEVHLQQPGFLPHATAPVFPGAADIDPTELRFQAPGGVSRWESKPGLKICGFTILTERGVTNQLVTFHPAMFVVTLVAEVSGTYTIRHGIAINDYLGNCVTRVFSPRDEFTLNAGETRQVRMLLNPNQMGPGSYVVGISVLEYGPLELLNSSQRFDLLSRSFVIDVSLPDSLGALESAILHTAEWQFGSSRAAQSE